MSPSDLVRQQHFAWLKSLALASGLENQADPDDGPNFFVAHSHPSGSCIVLSKGEADDPSEEPDSGPCLSLFFSSVTSGYGDPGDEDDAGDSAPALILRSMCPLDSWELCGESLDDDYPHSLIEVSKTLGLDRPHDVVTLDGDGAEFVAKFFFRYVRERR